MTEYNKIAEGVFTSTGVAKFIDLPFLPNSFEMWNITAMGTPTQNEITHAMSWRSSTAGTASVEYFNATPVLTTLNLASGGLSFIQAATYQYGPTLTITGITQAAAAVVTTSAPHGLATGDAVLIYGTTAMLQIAGEVYTVTVLSTTTFSINVNSSGFAAAATAGFCKQLLYPDLYIPYRCVITGVTTGATTLINLGLNHRFVVGQEVFIQIPFVTSTAWGMRQLDTEVYNTANIVPQQAYVTAVTASSITVNVNSTGYTAFAYPTSAQAALGMTFPAVYAIGDQNYGPTGPGPFPAPITVPGAFAVNTRQGVVIGLGNGTQLLQQTSDIIRWRAVYPDLIIP